MGDVRGVVVVVSPVSMSVVSTVAGDGDADVDVLAAGEQEEDDVENATVLCCGSRRRRISCMAISLPGILTASEH